MMKIEDVKVGEIYRIAFCGNRNYLVQADAVFPSVFVMNSKTGDMGTVNLKGEAFFAYPSQLRRATKAEKVLYRLEHA